MLHLAGALCGVCQKALIGVRDGAFCPVCECPIHIDCARSATAETPLTVCPRCGASKELAKQWLAKVASYEKENQGGEKAYHRQRMIKHGLVAFLFSGLPALVFILVWNFIREIYQWVMRRKKSAPKP